MSEEMKIYDYIVKAAKGEEVSLAEYKGKLLLVVNTATECVLSSQYKGLQRLYEEYQFCGLEILDFPCNQFMGLSPLSEEKIQMFRTTKYHTSFRLFKKVKVNGKDAEPLFKFLKEQKSGIAGGVILWNFTKFLVDREGNVVERFAPTTSPAVIENVLQQYI